MEDYKPSVDSGDEDYAINPKKRGFLNSWLDQYIIQRESKENAKPSEENEDDEEDDDRESNPYFSNKRWKRFFKRLFKKSMPQPETVLDKPAETDNVPAIDQNFIPQEQLPTGSGENIITQPDQTDDAEVEPRQENTIEEDGEGIGINELTDTNTTESEQPGREATDHKPEVTDQMAEREEGILSEGLPLYVQHDLEKTRPIEAPIENRPNTYRDDKAGLINKRVLDSHKKLKQEQRKLKKEVKKIKAKDKETEQAIVEQHNRVEVLRNKVHSAEVDKTAIKKDALPRVLERWPVPPLIPKTEKTTQPNITPSFEREKIVMDTKDQKIEAPIREEKRMVSKEAIFPAVAEKEETSVKKLIDEIEQAEKGEEYVEKIHEKRHEIKDLGVLSSRPTRVGEILPNISPIGNYKKHFTGNRTDLRYAATYPNVDNQQNVINTSKQKEMYASAIKSGFYIALAIISSGILVLLLTK